MRPAGKDPLDDVDNYINLVADREVSLGRWYALQGEYDSLAAMASEMESEPTDPIPSDSDIPAEALAELREEVKAIGSEILRQEQEIRAEVTELLSYVQVKAKEQVGNKRLNSIYDTDSHYTEGVFLDQKK
jgi:hypothetical protein